MEREYSRRDFLKIAGAGVASIALGSNLVGCSEQKEDKIDKEQLSEYHVFKQLDEENGLDSYLIIREQRYLDNYMYLFLNVAEDKYFYDGVFVTLEGINEEMDLDNGIDHTEFEPLLMHFDMIDLGNAKDIVGKEFGNKDQYKASEISKISALLKEKESNTEKVYTKN